MGFLFLSLALSLLLSLPVSRSAFYTLSKGSSLSVENRGDVLLSPNGVFSAGFYPVGENAYCFAIWFSKPPCSHNTCTAVWMANRDFPVNGKRSKLLLQNTGILILADAGKSTAWSTGLASLSSTELRLLDSGNLVLRNVEQVVLWQSFDSPTDTLLPSQELTRKTQLVSARSQTNYSSGYYKLIFDNDNILRLLYDGPDFSSLYWPYAWLDPGQAGRFSYNSSRVASFDTLGKLTSSDNLTFLSSDYGVKLQRRFTLDADGNARMYSREEGSTGWVVSWQAVPEPCRIHGLCGPNSTCTYDRTSGPKCSCLSGYRIRNPTDWSYGCEPESSVSCGNNTEVGFRRLPNVEFYGNDYGYHPNTTVEMCGKICLELCDCKGFQFKVMSSGDDLAPKCFPKTLLVSGQYTPSFSGDFYLKVPKTDLFSDNERVSYNDCPREILRPLVRVYPKVHKNGTIKFMFWFAWALGGIEMVGVLFVCSLLMIRSHKDSRETTEGYHIAGYGFKRFTYSDLKKATGNFTEEIGRGAGGTVYKGTMSDNRVAAIKRLHMANQGEAEFLAEVNTIGKLHHMNLIEMWGYCAEGKHRLLVYEYMEHGSLGENLSSKELDWQKRFEIAVGTARGLAYLHEECLEWVLHCDVKPQNILLDSNYQPKVSDFGLSKLLNRDDLNNSSFSRIRGTRGYMAPEWLFNLPITSKVDVYSYGIVVLEMVTGKSPALGTHARQSSEMGDHTRLVTWVRDKKKEASGKESWIEEMVDPTVEGEYEKDRMEAVVMMALECVQEDLGARPSMRKVVEMLLDRGSDY